MDIQPTVNTHAPSTQDLQDTDTSGTRDLQDTDTPGTRTLQGTDDHLNYLWPLSYVTHNTFAKTILKQMSSLSVSIITSWVIPSKIKRF